MNILQLYCDAIVTVIIPDLSFFVTVNRLLPNAASKEATEKVMAAAGIKNVLLKAYENYPNNMIVA